MRQAGKALWRNLGWQALANRQLARVSSARDGVLRNWRYASILQLLTLICNVELLVAALYC